MLIIPLTGKISRRNFPYITIFLILLNCLVFFIGQSGETEKHFKTQHWYLESGLAGIELTAYIEYRYTPEQQETLISDSGKIHKKQLRRLFREMRDDEVFLKKLKDGQIIGPEHADFAQWKKLRQDYDRRRAEIIGFRFGFKPADPDMTSLLTYMFLHGGGGHLVGNMIFLWLVGCLLEMGCGRVYYLGIYILTGLCAAGLFWAGNMQSQVPLVGASGAIAGFMGAFTVLYGRKKISVFYTIGIYFNYIKVRAILLLPVWMGIEIYQLFFSAAEQVAYLAHIGGLMSGAFLGYINKKYLKSYNEDALEQEPEDEITPMMEEAMQHVGRLEMEEGSRILRAVLKKDPQNVSAMKHLFDIYKTNPQDPAFHGIAKRLLVRSSRENALHGFAAEIYGVYVDHVRQPKLAPELYAKLCAILSAHDQPERAEKIVVGLLGKIPDYPGIPTLLLKLSRGYLKKGNGKKQQQIIRLLEKRFPESPEAAIARKSSS